MPIIFPNHNQEEHPMDIVSSHQRCLIAACMRTTGAILELGVGWYSTPLLHEIAKAEGRVLFTVDNNNDWLSQFKCLQCNFHSLHLIDWWGNLASYMEKQTSRIGVCFVDQGQPIEREYTTRQLLESNYLDIEVFVFHDTEEGFAYGYSRILGDYPKHYPRMGTNPGMFKYQVTDKCHYDNGKPVAWTTVASNKIDVREWGIIDLPPVGRSEEVT